MASGAGATETGGAAEAGAADGMDDDHGMDVTGDGDGNSGDGDGDSGDGDGDSGDGDGDSGDGDGDSGDGDGNSGDGDGDDPPHCGDGNIDPGEQCDDGAEMGEGFACLSDCTLNVCGDGVIGPTEGCDDGNNSNDDGCSASCEIEKLPDGAILCGNKLFACGDTLDNDMDGKIDLADPECTTVCDDDEGSFQTNLPGQNNDCKSDCYFDSNSGIGDDNCEWNLKCDPENPGEQIGCAYNPNFMMCGGAPSLACQSFCEPLTPDGCDCFGCCQYGDQFVHLGGSPTCTLATLKGGTGTCQTCTFNTDCANPCDECEVCFGTSSDDLPPECVGP